MRLATGTVRTVREAEESERMRRRSRHQTRLECEDAAATKVKKRGTVAAGMLGVTRKITTFLGKQCKIIVKHKKAKRKCKNAQKMKWKFYGFGRKVKMETGKKILEILKEMTEWEKKIVLAFAEGILKGRE